MYGNPPRVGQQVGGYAPSHKHMSLVRDGGEQEDLTPLTVTPDGNPLRVVPTDEKWGQEDESWPLVAQATTEGVYVRFHGRNRDRRSRVVSL